MKCELCEQLERNENILYQDNNVAVVARDYGFALGQVTIFPKQHLTILEMVERSLLEKCSSMANKVGVAVFDSLKVQGTNVLIQNGLGAGQKIPHFSIEVIPREREDNLLLQWQPQAAGDEEISTTFSLLREELEALTLASKRSDKESEHKTSNYKTSEKEEKQSKDEESGKEKSSDDDDGKNNYMIKSLRRIP